MHDCVHMVAVVVVVMAVGVAVVEVVVVIMVVVVVAAAVVVVVVVVVVAVAVPRSGLAHVISSRGGSQRAPYVFAFGLSSATASLRPFSGDCVGAMGWGSSAVDRL